MEATMPKTRRLRALLDDSKLCLSPGVYDGYSARVAEAMGFDAAAISGTGICASRLGQPEEIGIMSLLENAEACRHIAKSVSIPLTADADTGYGNAVTVYHAVQYFEEAGVAGINLEDQAWPKRCGHLEGIEVIEPLEMVKKIEAAVKARKDPDFIINARTDAFGIEGTEGVLKRAKIYAAAGADMLYPEQIRKEDDIRRIVEEVGKPVHINMGFGIRYRRTNPETTLKRLEEIGVARAGLPRILSAAAIMGMKMALSVVRESYERGEQVDRPDLLVNFDEIMDLVGYSTIEQLEREFLLPAQMEQKYRR